MDTNKQRQKEERLVNQLKDPDNSHNKEITKLIDKTLSEKHHVYLTGDWHLWLREEKNKPKCHKRSDFDTIVNTFKKLDNDDLMIYMGDLVDGEFQDKGALKEVLLSIPCKKIMVLGNNDLFGIPFYKSCGFDYVVQSFEYIDCVFTHIPIENDKDINVHSHLHNCKKYWVPYTNQIDVAYLGGRTKPVDLFKVLKSQKEYSKHISECPEHFNESYSNMFDTIMHGYIEDPCHDEE